MNKTAANNLENTTAYRILIADDEESTRKAMVRALELSGYQVKGAANGKEVFSLLGLEPFDLLLLDLHMPEMDGLQVMQRIIQEKSDLMVIVLTAHATMDSAITAVKAGAADYLKKPQSMESIKAAIQNALRKKTTERQRQQLLNAARQTIDLLQNEEELTTTEPTSQKTRCEEVKFFLNRERRQLHILGENENSTVELTADQAAILTLLAAHPGKIFTVQEIVQQALGYPHMDIFESQGIIRPHIQRLRRRLNENPYCSKLVETVRGSGYVLTCPIKLSD